jgi:esterase
MPQLLHYSVQGEGEPLILLHGLFGMGDNLAMIARPLSEFFKVYRLDLRNHGRSFRSEIMNFTQMAEDVLTLMDDQGMHNTHLLGHSLGGKVAMKVALQQPQRVNKLIVADIAPVAYPGHHDEVFAGINAVDLSALKSRSDADLLLQQHIHESGVRQFIKKNLFRNESGHFEWRINIEAIQNNYDQLRAELQSTTPFENPTLFIKGEYSNYIKMDYRQSIERLFPNAQLKIIQNTGHWLHAEKPVIFSNIVKKFLLASA